MIPSPPLETINDFTVSVSKSPKTTANDTTIIAVKAAGIFLVIRGSDTIINMVVDTRAIIINNALPCNQFPLLLNIPN